METLVPIAAFVVLCALLLAASIIDIRDRRIPNWLIALIVALWLAWRLVSCAKGSDPLAHGTFFVDFVSAIAFGCALVAFVTIVERLTGKFMMGGGDIKLLAALSLFLGINGILVALFAACIVSFAYAVAHLKRGIPFAPCILCGTLIALLV